jgi:hypothetical protein
VLDDHLVDPPLGAPALREIRRERRYKLVVVAAHGMQPRVDGDRHALLVEGTL